MDLLLFLAKPSLENIWYTSDGALRFAGLVAAGLVENAESQFSVGVRYGVDSAPTSPPTTALRMRLSEKGRLIVNSWLMGTKKRSFVPCPSIILWIGKPKSGFAINPPVPDYGAPPNPGDDIKTL